MWSSWLEIMRLWWSHGWELRWLIPVVSVKTAAQRERSLWTTQNYRRLLKPSLLKHSKVISTVCPLTYSISVLTLPSMYLLVSYEQKTWGVTLLPTILPTVSSFIFSDFISCSSFLCLFFSCHFSLIAVQDPDDEQMKRMR